MLEEKKDKLIFCDNYYPFGLTFNSWQRVTAQQNRFLYNQGTGDKQFKTERITDLGLNLDMTKFRMYDYQLGRFWQVDPKANQQGQESWTPYHYGFNSPVLYNDPYGDCPTCSDPLLNAGLVVGAFNTLKSTVTGALSFLSKASSTSGQIDLAVSTATTVQAIADNPGAVVDAAVNGVQDAANTLVNGTSFEQGQLVGSVAVGVADVVIGTKGAGTIAKVAKVADKVGDAAKAAKGVTNLTKSQLKSISSFEKQIATHTEKLKAYKADPFKFDNKGFLKNAPNDEVRQKIIQSRIDHLNQEIKTFQNNIQKILDEQ